MNEQQAIAAAIRVLDAMVETDAKLDAQASAATREAAYWRFLQTEVQSGVITQMEALEKMQEYELKG